MVLLLWILPAISTVGAFMIPNCRLQAGYPRGIRVWIPDVPGIESFTFRGQLNSPYQGEETGGLVGTVRAPFGGNWIFKVDGLVLNPDDVVYFWTYVIKEKQSYSRPNQTWTCPSRDKFVDLNSPIPSSPDDITEPLTTVSITTAGIEDRAPFLTTTLASKTKNESTTSPTVEKTTLPTTTQQKTTQSTATQPTTEKSTTTQPTTAPPSTTQPTTIQATTTQPSTTQPTTIQLTTTQPTNTEPTTTQPTMRATTMTAPPLTTDITTTAETTMPTDTTEVATKSEDDKTTEETTDPVTKTPSLEKRSTTEETKLENRMPNTDLLPPKSEDDIETTTPSLDKPVSEFLEEPAFGPFPPFFPGPYRPMLPPTSPELEICSNPFNFMEKPGETKTDKLERKVNRLQCELAQFQRKFSQLNNVVENELMDIKKLNYNMVSRMARLETLLLRASSAWS